jgi:type III secretion system chaperone SycN
MPWIQDSLREFGRQQGLSQLDFNRHGVMQLDYPHGGFLAVEPAQPGRGDEVLVYLARPVGHQAASLLRTALARACAIDGGAPFVQVGIKGNGPDTLMLVVARLPERSFTSQALSATVQYLDRWLDDVQAGRTR